MPYTSMIQTPNEANSEDNNPAVLLTTFRQQKTLKFKHRVKYKIREIILTLSAFGIQLKGILEGLTIRKGTQGTGLITKSPYSPILSAEPKKNI